jgi:hypothetical protein
METDVSELICLAEASARIDVPEKRLLGLAMRDDRRDPMLVDLDANGKPVVIDDWRLRRLQTSCLGDSA